jgi:hypothetical protein
LHSAISSITKRLRGTTAGTHTVHKHSSP